MARVTVEDCVLRVPNRFELVMLASQRARDVSAGAALTIERDNDRNPVIRAARDRRGNRSRRRSARKPDQGASAPRRGGRAGRRRDGPPGHSA